MNPNNRYIPGTGTTQANSQILSGLDPAIYAQILAQPNHGVGMPVQGPGIEPQTVVYMSSGVGDNSIELSKPATDMAGANKTYSFYLNGPQAPPLEQATSQLVHSILGDTIGELSGVPGFTTVAQRQAFTENTIIPLMEGVPGPGPEWMASRYPAPGNPQTSSDAKYNLDPIVWLIHYANPSTKQNNWPPNFNPVLAYAFSVDDGIGNITVNDSNAFQVDVGGSDGLSNKYPYSQPPVLKNEAMNPRPKIGVSSFFRRMNRRNNWCQFIFQRK